MADKEYIRFTEPASNLTDSETKQIGVRKKIVGSILFFIPNANPDYDLLMDEVVEWLLEIDSIDKLPVREIGIDKNGHTLFITPWKKNLGLWTDETITLDYFKENFNAVTIERSEFENRWNSFAENNP